MLRRRKNIHNFVNITCAPSIARDFKGGSILCFSFTKFAEPPDQILFKVDHQDIVERQNKKTQWHRFVKIKRIVLKKIFDEFFFFWFSCDFCHQRSLLKEAKEPKAGQWSGKWPRIYSSPPT